jgi:putative heme-binding domain-containing protein
MRAAIISGSWSLLWLVGQGIVVPAADTTVVPHGQSQAPGPALSPQQALERMEVPPGFQVELVASEPDIMNPVAMTFDARGRIWITESFEYPRTSAGPGRDRVKILEDTDQDGRVDRVTVFADGLNIPSGIAVGYGGVWVANAPDILFLRDTDGDDRADTRQIVVTGFGRTDTHELPNSLTWGPDGYLYGLNGVFNHSHVRHQGKEYKFTCALFRIDPRTHEFELFAEGTSNPWGIAWNPRGDAFVSACVIDHLWHLSESGYYHRQGGPYPPFTWKIGSIVQHKHQKAAYCGIHYFDSEAYPAKYRDRLYMGNIHGNCINVDVLEDRGATYFARPAEDFLSANDAWFMPVVQKTGPDGCLYVLDWYDRYHCYQDARRDPEGIDRGRGRLYRIRYENCPRAAKFDLHAESDEQLIARLHSPNVFFRDLAQRLLAERDRVPTRAGLRSLLLDDATPHKTRLHALWALLGGSRDLERDLHLRLLAHPHDDFRAWAVRAAGNAREVAPEILASVRDLAGDSSPRVRLQVAVAAGKLEAIDPLPVLLDVLAAAGEDELIPHIVWQNLHPRLADERFVALAAATPPEQADNLAAIMPRIVERLLALNPIPAGNVARLVALILGGPLAHQPAARATLSRLADRIHSGELTGAARQHLLRQLTPHLNLILNQARHPLVAEAALVSVSAGDPDAIAATRGLCFSDSRPLAIRRRALDILLARDDRVVLERALQVIQQPDAGAIEWRRAVLAALAGSDSPRVPASLLAIYGEVEPNLQPSVIETLTARPEWSRQMLLAIREGQLPASALHVNQVRKLLAAGDAELSRLLSETWGTLRNSRDPARERQVAAMRQLIRGETGDPHAGARVFDKVCGQCHRIYGKGQDVGPDITVNGRSSLDQLLSNVFDPSLVIGAGYQATVIVTVDGRVFSGLLVEDSPQRVRLKLQGGQVETIPRDLIADQRVSELSLMPEGIENQLSRQELIDLFAFLMLDRPPADERARRLPGAERLPDDSQ